jgi:hypothetical protein
MLVLARKTPEVGSSPCLRHDAGAVVRPDLRLVLLDQQIECGWVDLAPLDENALERANSELQLGKL